MGRPEMKAFVSHAYFTDDLFARSLYKIFPRYGITPFDHTTITDRQKCASTGGSDLTDLITAYRRAGRPAPSQEISDPSLHALLIDAISQQDILVVLWSEEYNAKFWT